MSELENEIALITGASRGIGREIAAELGRQGATIIGTATTDSGAEAISSWIAEAGLKGAGMRLNVTELDDITALIKNIKEEFGVVSVLVNNAGITRDNLLMRMKEEEWDDIMNTNLTAIFRMVKTCMRGMMKARQGRIINIGSVVGSSGNPGQANYAAAKAGVIGFTKSLAREVGSRNITVNTVAPGFIQTDMTDELTDEQKDGLMSQIPLNRLGSTADIAKAVAFLASPAAAYITGETLHVNGGMYMS